MKKGPDGLEVEIENAVALRKKARSFRGSLGTKENRKRQ
jgi:hypothetical protein